MIDLPCEFTSLSWDRRQRRNSSHWVAIGDYSPIRWRSMGYKSCKQTPQAFFFSQYINRIRTIRVMCCNSNSANILFVIQFTEFDKFIFVDPLKRSVMKRSKWKKYRVKKNAEKLSRNRCSCIWWIGCILFRIFNNVSTHQISRKTILAQPLYQRKMG